MFSKYRSCGSTSEVWTFATFIIEKERERSWKCPILKGNTALGIVTWSALGRQNRQAKKFLWVLGGSFAPHVCENVCIPASTYVSLVQYFSSYLYELQNHWNMTEYVSFRFPMFPWKMSVLFAHIANEILPAWFYMIWFSMVFRIICRTRHACTCLTKKSFFFFSRKGISNDFKSHWLIIAVLSIWLWSCESW